MKKISCLLLAFLFTVLLTNMSFAAIEEIDDPLVPTSPNTVTTTQYQDIDDDHIPAGPPSGPTIIKIDDNEVPKALPPTGGIPAESFYILGGLCIISAIIISRKRSKESTTK